MTLTSLHEVEGGDSLDPRPNPQGRVWGKNPAWKCLKHWNVAVGVDEG